MWLLRVCAVIYLTAACAAQDDATQTLEDLVTTPRPTTVIAPPVPTLEQVTPWEDVFTSEKVEFRCEVNSPDVTATWHKDGAALGKEGSLLSISSVTEADQGLYTCKAQLKSKHVSSGPSTGVNLKVHANKPMPAVTRSSNLGPMYPGENITFTCSVDVSSGWEYVWYHDGEEIHSSIKTTYNISAIAQSSKGDYYCKAKRMGKELFYTDASKTISLQVSDPPTPEMTQLTPWSDVFESETLEFSCDGVASGWTVTWFRDQKQLAKEGSPFSIPSVTGADEGMYACKAQIKSRGLISAESNTNLIKVYANKPMPAVTQSSNFDPMYPGENITFTCSVDKSSGWEYVWYHDGEEIQSSSRNTYIISAIAQSSKGDYHCKAKRMGKELFYTDASKTISLQVSDPPTPHMTRLTPWSDVFETETLEFSCDGVASGWTVTWFRDQKQLTKEGSPFSIPSVTGADEGMYACKAQIKSRGLVSAESNTNHIQVYANKPKSKLTRGSNFDPMYPGERITFTCSVNVSSGWEYVWYHEGAEIHSSSRNTYNTSAIDHYSRGDYYCKAKRMGKQLFTTTQSDAMTIHVSDLPIPTLKLLSPWSEVFKNEDLGFSCEVSSPEWTFTWFRDQTTLQNDSQVIVNSKGSLLNITSVTQSHHGRYTCRAELKSRGVISGLSNTTDITVHANMPTPKLRRNLDFVPMYVGETMTFTCSVDVSSDWSYQWYKDNNELLLSGASSSFTLAASDKGSYSCKASRGQKTSTVQSNKIQLDVKEIPVPVLHNATQWLDVFPTERVELSCGMTGSSGWIFTWFRNKNLIKANSSVLIENDGTKLSITAASTSHRGNYSCSGALKGRSVNSKLSKEVMLDIYDTKPRVTLVQNPDDSLMHTADSVSFHCHINVSSGWSYLWYKNDSPFKAGHHYNISSAGLADTGSYKCQVKRGASFQSDKSEAAKLTIEERPEAAIILLTRWADVFSTDSLLLKCNVKDSTLSWNYTWFKENEQVDLPLSEEHKVTPQDDPDQSRYTCKGTRNERPFYSVTSDSYRTKNLLLKRRILLAISGCIFFGIIAVFIGCIALRIFRKPASDFEKTEDDNLFIRAQVKDFTDSPCPLVEYIKDADLNPSPKEGEENDAISSETTLMPKPSPEDQAVTTNSHESTENGGGMMSFQH
ncbi:Fc receptor-like protein 5 [Nothobranchius furzeri]|uniref:Obscurin-like n=2 Tax=Nothobranchius furzeri TaxID=105023 RepID=A0A8C6P3W4_NOTFU